MQNHENRPVQTPKQVAPRAQQAVPQQQPVQEGVIRKPVQGAVQAGVQRRDVVQQPVQGAVQEAVQPQGVVQQPVQEGVVQQPVQGAVQGAVLPQGVGQQASQTEQTAQQQPSAQAQQVQGQSPDQQPQGRRMPATDVTDTPDSIIVTTDVPGCDAADLDIQATDNQLMIRAEPSEQEAEEGRSVQRERAPPAERVVQLPGSVEADESTATCENGVCRVELPKSEDARQREIAFQ